MAYPFGHPVTTWEKSTRMVYIERKKDVVNNNDISHIEEETHLTKKLCEKET